MLSGSGVGLLLKDIFIVTSVEAFQAIYIKIYALCLSLNCPSSSFTWRYQETGPQMPRFAQSIYLAELGQKTEIHIPKTNSHDDPQCRCQIILLLPIQVLLCCMLTARRRLTCFTPLSGNHLDPMSGHLDGGNYSASPQALVCLRVPNIIGCNGSSSAASRICY